MKLLVFLPTYNERDNLPVLIERLFELEHEVSALVVDDRSPDGTGEAAEELGQRYGGRVRVIHRDGPRGRGAAGIVGLREASRSDAEFVVEMDADLSHNPAQIPRLLEAAAAADLVIGSRYMEGGSAENFGLFRTLNSRVAAWLSYVILGLGETDPTSGYRVYRRELLEKLPWDRMISPGPSIVEETLYYIKRTGARIVEVPIRYEDRRSGATKITLPIILRWIVSLLRIRWTARTA